MHGQSTKKHMINVLNGNPAERTPIWFMRQAGRYLPEYREIRSKHTFLEMCQSPSAAAEVTLQPLRRYDLDAAIIISDILIPCVGMGQELTFDKGHGPILSRPVRTEEDFRALKTPSAARDLSYVGDAIALTKSQLKPHQTMIGFAGAPFTVATYMVEGGGTKTFTEIKNLAYAKRSLFVSLLDKIADVTVDYLQMQVSAGADCLMLFDTWAGQLPSEDYAELVLPTTSRLISEIRKLGVPAIYYPGQGSDNLYHLGAVQANAISVDWRVPMDRAVKILKDTGLKAAVQGNLDPQYLIGGEALVRQKVRVLLSKIADSAPHGHIFNVGHGLQPNTPPESLGWVIDAVRQFRS